MREGDLSPVPADWRTADAESTDGGLEEGRRHVDVIHSGAASATVNDSSELRLFGCFFNSQSE